MPRKAELDAAAARHAHVLEETGVWRARRSADEEDVAIERGLIRGRMPSARWVICPRTPASTVFAMIGSSGGSARNALGSEHGAEGSAHVSSTGVGMHASL